MIEIGVRVVAIVIMIIIIIHNKVGNTVDTELLETTPLNNYSFYYSLDNFPKYKVEAAEMVDELMEQGVSEQEACQTAIDVTSDKIYEDTLEFSKTQKEYSWDVDPEEREAELIKFMAKKQR